MRRALLAAIVAVLTLPAAAQASTLGAVGGLRDPAAGVLQLTVQAVETDGIGLRSATATLAGQALDTQYFAAPDCEPGVCPAVATVALTAPTDDVPDGPARLEVTVEDAAGTVTHVVDETITIANTLPTSTPTVTVSVGAGAKVPQAGPGGPSGPEPGSGGAGGGCRLAADGAVRGAGGPGLGVRAAGRPAGAGDQAAGTAAATAAGRASRNARVRFAGAAPRRGADRRGDRRAGPQQRGALLRTVRGQRAGPGDHP